jgi:hypothetical protein
MPEGESGEGDSSAGARSPGATAERQQIPATEVMEFRRALLTGFQEPFCQAIACEDHGRRAPRDHHPEGTGGPCGDYDAGLAASSNPVF